MEKVINFLEGKKTYIMVLLGLTGIILWAVGFLDKEQFMVWLSVSGLGSVASLRAAK